MTFYVENTNDTVFPFDERAVAGDVCEAVLSEENCPYDVEINIIITDNDGIRRINSDERGIDRETDVLSFPNLAYNVPSDFDLEINHEADCINPETGELILGDIIVSSDKVFSQADEYGHSPLREYAFLIAHSMYHLCGYDHMTDAEAKVMEAKQETVLKRLNITREEQ